MAYHISSACISCGACESECPVSAISEADGQYQINPDLCIDWRACAAPALSALRPRPNRT